MFEGATLPFAFARKRLLSQGERSLDTGLGLDWNTMQSSKKKTRVGILGYGNLGAFLHQALCSKEYAEGWDVAFVWNRSSNVLDANHIEEAVRLPKGPLPAALASWLSANEVDIIVEAAHPDIVRSTYSTVLAHTRYFVTSLTAFPSMTEAYQDDIAQGKLIIPSGAGWGFADISKMGQRRQIHDIHISMCFHPDALKLHGDAQEKLAHYLSQAETTEPCLIASGSIRDLANTAPNNCNTMVGLAIASEQDDAFDRFSGKLWADKSTHNHIVKIQVEGPGGFLVETTRANPAKAGAVTGSMTFYSFLGDLLRSAP